MKLLVREGGYLLVAVVLGLLLMPLLLWAIDGLLGVSAPADAGGMLSGHRQFYAALDEAVTWFWVLGPYVVFQLMRLFLSYQRSGNDTDIGMAVATGKVEKVELLVEAGVDINAANTTGQTPLHLAAASGNDEMVRVLLEDGAELDLPDSGEGLSALHVAARDGDARVVDLLIRYGADLEACTRHQQTPLHLAALNGHAEVTAQLLKYHVRLDSRDADGMTAEQLAEQHGHQNVVELITHYADNSWAYLQISNG